MVTAMRPGGPRQAAQFVTLAHPSLPSNALTLTVAPAKSTVSRVYLTTVGNANAIAKGRTLQFVAHSVYSDGSVHLLPDTEGNGVTLWYSSNRTIPRISTLGHLTAISTGSVVVMAHVGSLISDPFPITVVAASPSASSATSQGNAVMKQTIPAGSETAQQGPSSTSSGKLHSPDVSIPQGPATPLPDLFAGPLWLLTAPAGGSASISQGHLFLGVPGGSNHDASAGQNDAVRVVQSIASDGFDTSIRIDSLLSASDANTSEGLMVIADERNYITYALDTDGTAVGLSLHTVTNGEPTTVLKDSALSLYRSPMYMRLTHMGTEFTAFYSVDGQNWVQAASFNHSMKATEIGPSGANHSEEPANAVPVVMSVGAFDSK